MRIEIREGALVPTSRSVVMEHLSDIRAMVDFVGYGPVPGIKQATWLTEGGFREGARRQIENLDGSRHEETIIEVSADRIVERAHGFTSPIRLLVHELVDTFVLTEREGITELQRIFVLHLRHGWYWPLGAMLAFCLRRALRRHHLQLAGRCGDEGAQ